jgi:hypothetical protein
MPFSAEELVTSLFLVVLLAVACFLWQQIVEFHQDNQIRRWMTHEGMRLYEERKRKETTGAGWAPPPSKKGGRMDCQMGHTRQDDSITVDQGLSPEKDSLKYASLSEKADYLAEEIKRLLPHLSANYAVSSFATMSPGNIVNMELWEVFEYYAEAMRHRESYDPSTSDNMERKLSKHHEEYAKVHQS